MLNKSQLLLFLAVTLPLGFLFSGGIAAVTGYQGIDTFFYVFVWYCIIQFMLFDFFFNVLKIEKEKEAGE